MACIDRHPACRPAPPGEAGMSGLEHYAFTTGMAGVGGLGVGILLVGALGMGFAGVFLAAVVTALTVVIWWFISLRSFGAIRCNGMRGTDTCVAGVVLNIEPGLGSGTSLPFLRMHDRIDILVTSFFWDIVEEGASVVRCTGAELPRRSEILWCYYYTPSVCSAMTGSYVGAGVGAVAGVGLAAAAVVALGCSTIIACLFALILAVLIVLVTIVVSTIIGGWIGEASAGSSAPEGETDEGTSVILAVGDLITVRGNLVNVGQNIIYWVQETVFHGTVPHELPRPFSYCEIDEQLPAGTEGCIGPG